MIDTRLTRKIVNAIKCPIKYCGASKGEYCKTPSGKTCEDLHKRRYGKYVRRIGFAEFAIYRLVPLKAANKEN